MRVIVCGGRDYANRERVYAVLDKLHREAGISRVIEGGALGADRLASDWSESLAVPTTRYEADWEAYGNFAGPKRNAMMIEDGEPDLVIAFPGGAGTRNMIKLARKAGLDVVEIAP